MKKNLGNEIDSVWREVDLSYKFTLQIILRTLAV